LDEKEIIMGMYTGVRARVKVEERFRPAITKLHEDADWASALSIPNIEGWLNYGRHNFIPFGVLAYMPDAFGDPFETRKDKYGSLDGGSTFDGVWWTFSCSLKNYESEIDFFMTNVLRSIVEDVDYCESLYEDYPLPDYGMFDIEQVDYDCREWWGQFVTDWSDFLLGKTKDSP
jgi:hypothetical protein